MNYSAIIQARMGSSRLPGKSMMKIGKYSMLEILVKRLLKHKNITEVIVATSVNQIDDLIENFADSMNIICYRGDENDVLSRVAEAAKIADNTDLVELYGDSPIFCSEVFDILRKNYETGTDLVVTNALKTSFIPGMEMYIYSRASMIMLNSLVPTESQMREHVGYNFKHSGEFNIQNVTADQSISDLNHFHLEVDELSDLKFMKRLFSLTDAVEISLSEILIKLQNEHKFVENTQVERRWQKYRDN